MAACLVYCVELVLWQHVLCIVLSWCCGSMPCVLCESYTVQNEPVYGCALCGVQRETGQAHANACLVL